MAERAAWYDPSWAQWAREIEAGWIKNMHAHPNREDTCFMQEEYTAAEWAREVEAGILKNSADREANVAKHSWDILI